MNKKRKILKKAIYDGKGGPGRPLVISTADASAIAPYKNAFYKRVKAAKTLDQILRMTGMRGGDSKYPKSKQEALDQLSGN